MKGVENNMATETIDAIKKAINHFNTLQRPDQAVSIKLSKSGQFLLHVESKTKDVLIRHGWKDQKKSFNNPGTIDIFLSDKESAETLCYVYDRSRTRLISMVYGRGVCHHRNVHGWRLRVAKTKITRINSRSAIFAF